MSYQYPQPPQQAYYGAPYQQGYPAPPPGQYAGPPMPMMYGQAPPQQHYQQKKDDGCCDGCCGGCCKFVPSESNFLAPRFFLLNSHPSNQVSMSYNNQYPQQPQQAYQGQQNGAASSYYGPPQPGGEKGFQQYGYPQQQPQGGYGAGGYGGGGYGQQPMMYQGQPPMGYPQQQPVYVQPNQGSSGPGCCAACLGALACW
ncbi:hypothetical protein JCM3765_007582 [Sporobolomyces pararoseus]